MAYYLTALNLAFFLSFLVVVRKLLGRRSGQMPRRLALRPQEEKSRRESILDRIRDWAFPNLPMV